MNRASEFIQLYNRLNDHLLSIGGADRSTPFSQLVNSVASRNAVVRQYALRLRDFGDLRNAIVHYRAYPSQIIAEPSPEALAEFAAIVESIISPRRLIPTYQRQVKVYQPRDPLVEALKDMGAQDFSQIVLMNESHLTLLTTAGIARWLEKKATDDIISIQAATVGEAHTCEPPGALLVMSRDKTIFDAEEAFTRAPNSSNSRLFAVIVTQNGRDTERPLGIVTPWDLLGNG